MASTPVNKYPYPLGVNVGDFVPIKLSPTNYFIWRKMMLNLLKSHGLDGFINGEIYAPPQKLDVSTINGGIRKEMEINKEYQDWERSDGLLRRWIQTTLNEDTLAYVVSLPTAQEMWRLLERGLSQPFLHEIEIDEKTVVGKELSRYLSLSKAALNGDWDKAKEIFEQEPEAVRAVITGASETALMIAARSARRLHFLKQLVGIMTPADLGIANYTGATALHMAAGVGNAEAAELLVNKNPLLPNVMDSSRTLPLHVAAVCGKRGMVLYLLTVTNENAEPKPFEGEPGVKLVHDLIAGGLYDIALYLVQRYRKLACTDPTPLKSIALKRSAFRSGVCLNFWQHLIYSCVPMKVENIKNYLNGKADIENTTNSFISVPQIKHIKDTKSMHYQAQQLVKHLCMEIAKLDHKEASKVLGEPLRIAASIGVNEVVEEILCSFPSAIYLTTEKKQTLFHLAIANRRENVFNIIYQVEFSHMFLSIQDSSTNNCLHLAGYLDNQQKLNLRDNAAGAALQVQRELQWFKEVEKFSLVQAKEIMNASQKTPAMVFTETHQELVKEGEQWMKDTSNSCTIVAALIVTVVFAAAITVPGGNDGNTGLPFFETKKAFVIFAVSDALALFSSASSVLMFLSILTSRYGEQDFLYALPKRLIIGLATLFLSILFMMIAFGATLEIVFGDKKSWILIPVVALACIPVMLFVSLQFPLLWDMIKSTYGSGIFGKQSDRILF